MKSETQAYHLAKMMLEQTRYPRYELSLPLVLVRSNKLKKLAVDDVLLLGLGVLEFVLMDGERSCAKLQLRQSENNHELEITDVPNEPVEQLDSKKYKILKLSFGTVQSKVLEVGHRVDITQLDLMKVTLVQEGKTIAEGSLANVDEEIAIQIKKVK
jgi:flagellar motor switch/type III secretory pathway protein FliN